MRDVNRIYPFVNELRTIWSVYYPDLRFAQFMMNFLSYVALQSERDPFFIEDAMCLKYLKEYAKKSPLYKENK